MRTMGFTKRTARTQQRFISFAGLLATVAMPPQILEKRVNGVLKSLTIRDLHNYDRVKMSCNSVAAGTRKCHEGSRCQE